jgi:hypothetical protein
MAVTLPGAYVPWLDAQFHDGAGAPLVGGLIEFFEAGLSVHKTTWNTAQRTPGTENTNPIVLNTEGRAPNIFLDPGGYDVTISDGNGVQLFTLEGIEDIGLTWASSTGVTVGATNVTTGYTVLATDQFVTVDSSAGATVINLPPAAQHPLELTIKNLAVNTVAVTPNGVELLENTAAAYTLPAPSGANLPTIVLMNDGVSSWWIQASHGL